MEGANRNWKSFNSILRFRCLHRRSQTVRAHVTRSGDERAVNSGQKVPAIREAKREKINNLPEHSPRRSQKAEKCVLRWIGAVVYSELVFVQVFIGSTNSPRPNNCLILRVEGAKHTRTPDRTQSKGKGNQSGDKNTAEEHYEQDFRLLNNKRCLRFGRTRFTNLQRKTVYLSLGA